MIPNPTMVSLTHMMIYKGARFFLVIKAVTRFRFVLVIGIRHPHTCSSKYALYVEVCEPQGHIFKYKGPAFSLQSNYPFGSGLFMVIAIGHPHNRRGTGTYVPYI